MAWGRKKGSGRKEPLFGLAAALGDLRPDPKDRLPAAEQKPKKSAKRRIDDDDDDPPPPPARKARVTKSGSKRRSKSAGRSRLGRLVYWTAVLGLWAGIAVFGVVIWVGAHLP